MDFEEKEYRTIIYTDKKNQVVVKFHGFKNKEEADMFSKWITLELGIDAPHQNSIRIH